MRQLRDDGVSLIFVTHFLDQVYAVSDRITVLQRRFCWLPGNPRIAADRAGEDDAWPGSFEHDACIARVVLY